jgi:hypothetical protein
MKMIPAPNTCLSTCRVPLRLLLFDEQWEPEISLVDSDILAKLSCPSVESDSGISNIGDLHFGRAKELAKLE